MKFTQLFSSKKDARIQALQTAIDANEHERKWAFSFMRRGEALQKAVEAAHREFERQPSDAAAEAVLKAARDYAGLGEDLHILTRSAWQLEQPRQPQRLLAVLPGALNAVIERLTEILRDIEAADKEQAAKLAMEHDDVRSPVRGKIDRVIGEANDFLRDLAAGKLDRVGPAVNFVLVKGSEGYAPEVFKR